MTSEPKGNRLMKYFTDYMDYDGTEHIVRAYVAELAKHMNDDLPSGSEKTVGLRKLLEAQDAFLRAAEE